MKFGETSLTSLPLLHSSPPGLLPAPSQEEIRPLRKVWGIWRLSAASDPCMAVLQRVEGIWGNQNETKMQSWGNGEMAVSWGSSECLSMIWLKVGRVYPGGQSWTPREEAFESLPANLRW